MMDLTCDSTRGRDSSHKRQLNADGLSSQNEPIVSSWLVSLCYNSSKAFEPIGHHVYQLLLPALSTLHIQTEGDVHFLLNICLKKQSIPMPTIIAVFTMCRSSSCQHTDCLFEELTAWILAFIHFIPNIKLSMIKQ
jgi:hypothetical protein